MSSSNTDQQQSPSIDDRIQAWVIWLLRLSLVIATLYAIVAQNWETVFISILALVLTGLPLIIERRYNLRLPVEYDFIIVLFIYTGLFLGETGNAYERFWWWDIILHISSGVVLAFCGFLLQYNLYQRQRLQASPLLMSVIAFSVGLAAGALWEIFEFIMDLTFGLNMQKSGLRDTMGDLIIDGIGALLVARLAYKHVLNGKGGLLSQMIKSFLLSNPRLRPLKRERR